jgi:hypothetical protein
MTQPPTGGMTQPPAGGQTGGQTGQAPPQGQQGQANNGCPQMVQSKCNDDFTMYCKKTGLFTGISQITCDGTIPAVCDVTKAAAEKGDKWYIDCGRWVIATFLGNEKFNIKKALFGLCDVVAAANTVSARRQLAESYSSIQTISPSADPTRSDTVARIDDATINSTTGNITIDGSTTTTSSGATAEKLAEMEKVGASVSANTTSSHRYGCALVMIAFYLVSLLI